MLHALWYLTNTTYMSKIVKRPFILPKHLRWAHISIELALSPSSCEPRFEPLFFSHPRRSDK